MAGDNGDAVHGGLESLFVGLGWLAVARDLADELQGGEFQLFVGGRSLGEAELFNVSTHGDSP